MISPTQRSAIEDLMRSLTTATAPRGKRKLAGMFLHLVPQEDWPEYYKVIPEPRALNDIRAALEENRYSEPLDVYTDLALVFWNAMFYNEEDSQIANDAKTLKGLLDSEWKQQTVLPVPRSPSPPPRAPQKVHATEKGSLQSTQAKVKIAVPTPVVSTPAESSKTAKNPRVPSPSRPSSPDMDIDVGGSPEPDGQPEDYVSMPMTIARDEEGEAVIKQLERGLPRWKGYGELGWATDIPPERWVDIVHAIKSHKDVINNNRLSVALEAVPEDSAIPNLSFHHPLSLKIIEAKARGKLYASSKEFDLEMIRLFEKGRRYHNPGSEGYGRVLLLQRLYQAITSKTPIPGPPYASTTNFASLRAGPGTARPLHSTDSEGVPGVTTFRVSTKDRKFVDEITYKGWSIRLADFLHLSNPDDPSRPIIAQVFKVWMSDEAGKESVPGITACWYYRPEQTWHPSHRQFWEGEVFKTSHFADHTVEDIIEKIGLQFTARHIRGRPRPPFWYPGWPLYVCDSRYNDRERIFVRIKNWNSCVPEEVRKSTEFMPIYPFERMVHPKRFISPFLQNKLIKGPGGIEESTQAGDGEHQDAAVAGGTASSSSTAPNVAGSTRKRSRRTTTAGSATDHNGPSKGLYVGVAGGGVPPPPPVPIAASMQTPRAVGSQQQQQQQQLNNIGPPIPPPAHLTVPLRPTSMPMIDRSVLTAAGGALPLANQVVAEKLPPEIAKHFDRDPETNEVLWFSAPPVDRAREPGPQHSLKYLHFLAMKRKRENEATTASGNNNGAGAMEVDEGNGAYRKSKVPKTVTEALADTLAAVGQYQ